MAGRRREALGRPASDSFAAKVAAITNKILDHNRESLKILKSLKDGKTITVPPAKDGTVATVHWNPDAAGRLPVDVHLYYMMGNHDWFYHLPGPVENLCGVAIGWHPASLAQPHESKPPHRFLRRARKTIERRWVHRLEKLGYRVTSTQEAA